jgi:hypothetical protein
LYQCTRRYNPGDSHLHCRVHRNYHCRVNITVINLPLISFYFRGQYNICWSSNSVSPVNQCRSGVRVLRFS